MGRTACVGRAKFLCATAGSRKTTAVEKRRLEEVGRVAISEAGRPAWQRWLSTDAMCARARLARVY